MRFIWWHDHPQTRISPLICLGFLLAALPAAKADNEPEVLVELSQQRVFEGESVRLRVTLSRVQNPKPPKLEGFDDFDVQPAGETSLDSRQITIINGKVTEVVQYGRAYDYVLAPRRSGLLEIPGPVAEVNGRTIRGRTLSLEVIAPQSQDVAIVQIVCDRTSIYPMQPFSLTLTVAIKGLPSPFEDRNPVGILRRLPVLSMPWVDDDSLPKGIEAETPWQRWLGQWQSRRGVGFSINKIGGTSVFSLFDEGPLAFLPEARQTTRTDDSGSAAAYWEFDFTRQFTPQRIGQFTFGPVSLKGTFVTDVNRRGEADTQDIYAIARPVVVTVKDVPSAGRPESYIGAIGQFALESSVVPTSAKVGDPLTLTITLRGHGALDGAVAPALDRIPAITERFRIHEATEEPREVGRRFTYSLRPTTAGDIRLPSIPVSYFDVEQEKFITLKTESLTISVVEAERLTGSEIAMAGQPGTETRPIEVRQDGILANITDPSALRDQSVNAPRWFALFACLAGAYIALVFVSGQIQQLFGDAALLRRRAAAGRARRRLQAARVEIDAQKFREAADHLRAALVGLVADVADVPEAGLTSGDVGQRLAELEVDSILTEKLTGLLEACDGARYGASAEALRGLGADSEQLLEELLSVLQRKKLLK